MATTSRSRLRTATTRNAPGATREERLAAGKALRGRVPRELHGEWRAPRGRCGPVDLAIASSKGRIPQLVPIRYGRMAGSPFAFFRGTALNMAADLATTPSVGVHVQACGDCHLLNFGSFATPERRVVFDINDFDETLPGPWEWDVKRLAASFVHAGRANGFAARDQRDAALACARAYRTRMAEFATMRAVEVWYARMDLASVLASLAEAATKARVRKRIAKAAAKSVPEDDFPKMVEAKGGKFAIKDNPPLIQHDQLFNLDESRANVMRAFAVYRTTLPDDRRVLLDRYRPTDLALKVVGVGSVGTFCGVVLMMADNDDPLFLQVKEGRPSVLEPYVGKSAYANRGRRIVEGQRLMQSASDIFLGWTHSDARRHFYVRRLREIKFKPQVAIFEPATLIDYADLCGWTLARAHARSGDAAMIAGYLGKGEVFDLAIARFARSYADQGERDHATFVRAIRQGRIEAIFEQ